MELNKEEAIKIIKELLDKHKLVMGIMPHSEVGWIEENTVKDIFERMFIFKDKGVIEFLVKFFDIKVEELI